MTDAVIDASTVSPDPPDVADALAQLARDRLSEAAAAGRAADGDVAATVVSEHVAATIRRGQAPPDGAHADRLTRAVAARVAGAGRLEPLLADEAIEDIWCNGCDDVFVRYSDNTRRRMPPVADSDDELIAVVRSLASGGGVAEQERRFDRSAPILDCQLPGGARLHATMSVTRRPHVSIRRHRHVRVDLAELTSAGTMLPETADFLAAATAAKLNILVAGQPAAGKTTLLRALAGGVDATDRIVTIEDSFELGLDADGRHPNAVAMQARPPNIEGRGAVTVAELFRSSLRAGTDRLIVGEVRGEECLPMLHAMTQGNNGSMSTVHALSSKNAFTKLMAYAVSSAEGLEPAATAMLIGEGVDLVVHIHRGVDGVRRVTSVREVLGAEGREVISNELYAAPAPDGPARAVCPVSPHRGDRLAAVGWRPPGLHGDTGGRLR